MNTDAPRAFFTLLILGVSAFGLSTLVPEGAGTDAVASYGAAVTESITQSITQKSASLRERKLTASYKNLSREVDSGLRQSGVSPEWRDRALKKLESLRKQGLDEKRTSALRAKIAKLPVGGERMPPQSLRDRAGCTASTSPVFTHAFTDLQTINAINPIGGIGGGSPGRSYIGVKDGKEAPLYAPMDATLRTIIYADRGAGYGEYGLIFEAGCGVEFMFDHMDRVAPRILQYAPKVAAKNSQTQDGITYAIPIRAGELLGYSNGTDLAHTFDFLVMNYSRRNNFLNPARWEWEQALYATCPYDYFVADLRSQYYAKLGRPSSTGFIKAPSCGNPSHDVAGTLSGSWFKNIGTIMSTDKRGEYLAVARSYDGVQIAYRKDGQAFATPADVQAGRPYLNLTDNSPEKYPREVQAGESICYTDNRSWVFLRLVSEKELAYAKGAGPCPATFPDSQAETWQR